MVIMKRLLDVENILVMDDSGTARLIIKQCLEIAGLYGKCFYEARNGCEGLEILHQHAVDLVFTDLNMPEMDGEDFLIYLGKRVASFPDVIVITSSYNPIKEQRLKRLGAKAVLKKPISPAQVAQILREMEEGFLDDSI